MGCEKAILRGRKSQISLKRCDIDQKLEQSVDITCISLHSILIANKFDDVSHMTSTQDKGHLKSPISKRLVLIHRVK